MNAQPNMFDKATADNSLQGFLHREAKRMWPAATHRKRSVAQVMAFAKFGDNLSRPLSQFLPRDIHAFADHLLALGKSDGTVNRYLASISKVFAHAVDERVITQVMKIKFQPSPKGAQRFKTYSTEEQALIVDFFRERGDDWMAHMFILGCKTGMRLGEILQLSDGTASISKCGSWVELRITKTGKPRNVAISHPDAKQAAQFVATKLADYYSKKAFYYRWGLCKREFGRNDPDFTFHATRHTAASHMANELSINTIVIAQALGHSSLQTTQKYVKAKPNHLLDIGKQM